MTDAQFGLLMGRLTEIRNLLALAIEGPEPVPAECEHPAELRYDLSTMTRAGFQCRGCGFIYAIDRRTGEPISVK